MLLCLRYLFVKVLRSRERSFIIPNPYPSVNTFFIFFLYFFKLVCFQFLTWFKFDIILKFCTTLQKNIRIFPFLFRPPNVSDTSIAIVLFCSGFICKETLYRNHAKSYIRRDNQLLQFFIDLFQHHKALIIFNAFMFRLSG